MPVLRNPKVNRFVQVENEFLESSTLSWRAKGIFCYLLSRPDGWKFNLADLKNRSPLEGLDAIKSGMRELEMAGYVAKHKVKSVSKGRWSGWEYLIRETPFPPRVDYPMSVEPMSDDPLYINTVPVSILSCSNTEPEKEVSVSRTRPDPAVSRMRETNFSNPQNNPATEEPESQKPPHSARPPLTSDNWPERRLAKMPKYQTPKEAWFRELKRAYDLDMDWDDLRDLADWSQIYDAEKCILGLLDDIEAKRTGDR